MQRVLRLVSWVLPLVFITGLLASAHLSAQAGSTAQITGTVRDESGGVLPGVTVTATQTDTGFKRDVVTDTNGSYTLANLPVGPYKLEAMLSGFRTYSRTGVVLQVNSNPVVDVALGSAT